MNRDYVKSIRLMVIVFSVFLSNIYAQESDSTKAYKFEVIKELKTTSVKNQSSSGTCWAFATISFLESEALRIGGKEFDLSEMFIVRNAYITRSIDYVRFHGKAVFSPGGQAHDVINEIRDHGLLPEDVYKGLNIGKEKHNHSEMDAVLKSFVDAIVKNRGGEITPVWLKAFTAIVDAYLGDIPENFEYEGDKYNTSVDFAKNVGLDPDDYVEITSYNHHPFYTKFDLEIPDNWSHDLYYNVPLDDLITIMNNALENGYTIAWDGDVSEKSFSFKNGVAIIPAKDWSDKTGEEKEKTYKEVETEKEVSENMRQKAFNNFQSTDDHLMHITGLVKDQNGTYYYKIKNSWSEKSNDFGGYINLSEAYVRLKTLAIMVHKDAIPKALAKKLKLK